MKKTILKLIFSIIIAILIFGVINVFGADQSLDKKYIQGSISYMISSNWDVVEKDNGKVYFYPNEGEGFILTSYSPSNVSILENGQSEKYLEGIVDSLEEVYSIYVNEPVVLSNTIDAHRYEFTCLLSDKKTTIKQIAFNFNDNLYEIGLLLINDYPNKDLESQFEELLDTITISTNDSTDSNISIGETNAVKKAKQYLSIIPYSYNRLIEQLKYEGFTEKEAIYGADHCEADWFEQAAKKAADYLELMTYSKDRLIEQLEYEGFTHEQAVYGAEQNGY